MDKAAKAANVLELRRQAEQLAAHYPVLLAEADRVAAIISQGIHGRRQAGQGETFWQYRNYQSSDAAHLIDWRRSARGDQAYVRDNEWDAANTVYFWRDGRAGMEWSSSQSLPTKKDRASIICMALAILLIRAGERCAVIHESDRARSGSLGVERVTHRLALSQGSSDSLQGEIPSHARIVIASDFLEHPDIWQDRLAYLSGRPAKGVLIHIIDPAEREFPYKGRLRMQSPGISQFAPLLVGRAERAKIKYQEKFTAHCEALTQIARRLDWPLIQHETDQPPTTAVTALYQAIAQGVT